MSEFAHKPRRAGGIAGKFTAINANERPCRESGKSAQKQQEAQICLNCKKSRCRGSKECFKHEREVHGK